MKLHVPEPRAHQGTVPTAVYELHPALKPPVKSTTYCNCFVALKDFTFTHWNTTAVLSSPHALSWHVCFGSNVQNDLKIYIYMFLFELASRVLVIKALARPNTVFLTRDAPIWWQWVQTIRQYLWSHITLNIYIKAHIFNELKSKT